MTECSSGCSTGAKGQGIAVGINITIQHGKGIPNLHVIIKYE